MAPKWHRLGVMQNRAMPLVVGVVYSVTFSNEPDNYKLNSGGKYTSLLMATGYISLWAYFPEEDYILRQPVVNTWGK